MTGAHWRARRLLGPTGAVLAALWLAGCAAQGCTGNPATDSAACAANALSNGAYATSTTAQAAEVQTAEQQAEAARLQQASLTADLASLQARRGKIEKALQKLTRQLDDLRKKRATGDAQVAGLTARIAALRSGLTSKTLTPDQVVLEEQALDILSQQIQRLAATPSAG